MTINCKYLALSALLVFVDFSVAELRITKLNDLFKLRHHELERKEPLFNLKNSPEAERFIEEIMNDKTKDVPKELDWRKEGRVTKVKSSWDNGSSMTGLLEGQMAKLNITMVDLSVQQLIDCLKNDKLIVNRLNELAKFGGIVPELWYPYIGQPNYRCLYDKTKSVMSIKGGALLPPNDEEKLKEFVAKYGPVGAFFDTSGESFGKFYYYHGGVFDIQECKTDLPITFLLIVGYGTDEKLGDYWLARNNYGTRWGEDGYIRVARGKNMCGIASFPTIAII